jgi:hypothetical protein
VTEVDEDKWHGIINLQGEGKQTDGYTCFSGCFGQEVTLVTMAQ